MVNESTQHPKPNRILEINGFPLKLLHESHMSLT